MSGGPTRIVILHGVADASRPDERDTLDQVDQVARALTRLGHPVSVTSVDLGLSALESLPRDAIVFNLVEAIAGDGRLIHLVPAVLEHLGLAYTGAGPAAMVLSSSKTLSKALLRAAHLEVPESLTDPEAHADPELYIVKSEWEDASYGLDAGSVVQWGKAAAEISARQSRYGGMWFAERFIEGREFNISLLGHEPSVRILPPAEIVFRDYPEGRPRIVDYEAKWDRESFAYQNTARQFLDIAAEPLLAARLHEVALAAYRALDLRDYGRVDIRLAEGGTPYVLEVNANPCISDDAGFVAAAAEAGLGFDDVIREIVAAASTRVTPRPHGPEIITTSEVGRTADPLESRPDQEATGAHLDAASIEPGIPQEQDDGIAPGEPDGAAHPSSLLEGSQGNNGPDAAGAEGLEESRAWSFDVEEADVARVRALVASTGFFTPAEIDIAAELVTERLQKGPASGYEFVLHEHGGRLHGYTCFGLIPGSDISFDLYWIAVDPAMQGQGLGRNLLDETERIIRALGGRRLYADTSSSSRYAPTRAYYLAAGFREAARLADFYREGDGKVIYEKIL